MDSIVTFRITVCGIEELDGHCEAGVSHVLSILDPDWPVPEAFGTYGEHARLELRFHDVIERQSPLTILPQPEHVTEILAFGRHLASEPVAHAHLLVHCHAGVSRSTASMALILAQARPDLPAERIFGEVTRIRPQAWPNLRIIRMGDDQLGRGGKLVEGAADIYRMQLRRRPELAREFIANGRGCEIELARG
jgi:predicted protein tyrosine phosphatase